MENAFTESFKRRFRDESLNGHRFITVEDARARTEAWRLEYNTERPHGALEHLAPSGHARQTELELAETSDY